MISLVISKLGYFYCPLIIISCFLFRIDILYTSVPTGLRPEGTPSPTSPLSLSLYRDNRVQVMRQTGTATIGYRQFDKRVQRQSGTSVTVPICRCTRLSHHLYPFVTVPDCRCNLSFSLSEIQACLVSIFMKQAHRTDFLTKNEIRLKIKIFCFYSETLKNFFRDILLTVESGETSKARPRRSPRSPGHRRHRRHRSTDDETGAVDLVASQFKSNE